MPTLLVAPKPSDSAETERDEISYGNDASRGYYSDGAYTAAPTIGPSIPLSSSSSSSAHHVAENADAQLSYYASLRLRFSLLRATMRCQPSAEAIAALDDSHPISLPQGSQRAFTTWKWLLKTTDPLPAQMACLDHESVLRIIAVATALLKSGKKGIGRRFGAWVWGLLGKVRDVGELSSEEVAVLRELGKQAVWVKSGRAVRSTGERTEVNAEEDEVDEWPDYEDGGEQGDGDVHVADEPTMTGDTECVQQTSCDLPSTESELLAAAKRRLQATLDRAITTDTITTTTPALEPQEKELPLSIEGATAPAVEATAEANGSCLKSEQAEFNDDGSQDREAEDATLDMILTIVGEFYGQRDLLEHRDLWEEGEIGEDGRMSCGER